MQGLQLQRNPVLLIRRAAAPQQQAAVKGQARGNEEQDFIVLAESNHFRLALDHRPFRPIERAITSFMISLVPP